jgi:hypothetical protein
MRILMRSQAHPQWGVVDSLTYQDEAELQKLLADDPTLIPVADIGQDITPFCVGVRELSVPGSGYIDILAFSPQGNIAIVECKLASNAEIKRKVIGQILEYAAFVWGMSYEELDSKVRERSGHSLIELVTARSGEEVDEQAFREAVTQRLSSGALLLMVVVDQITPELARTMEFLNDCGGGRFSLHALEMRRFGAQGTEILVPRLHGVRLTTQAITSPRQKWDEKRFFETLEAAHPELTAVVRDLFEWARLTGHAVKYGTGNTVGSFAFYLQHGERLVPLFYVDTNGSLFLYMLSWKFLPGNLAEQLHTRLIGIRRLADIPLDFKKFPAVRLAELDAADIATFKAIFESLRAQLSAAQVVADASI